MLRRSLTLAGLALCGLLGAAATVGADDDHGGRTVRRPAVAIQTITVPPGSPLEALGLPPEFPLVAVGGLVFEFDRRGRAFVGQAEFVGDVPFPFVLASDAFPGTLTRVRRGYEFEAVAPFYLTTEVEVAPGVVVPARLFTLEDATFTATLRGRGFPPGTTFVSPESVALGMELDFGGGMVIVFADPPVAFSSARTVEVVTPGGD